MDTKNFLSLTIIILLSILISSCDAPRNNPIDPGNPDNVLTTLNGTVQTFSLPYMGLNDVSVYWNVDNKLVKTNANGKFEIFNVTKDNGSLIFSKDGYFNDTVNISWGSDNTISIQTNLNKIPVLDSISLYTVVINNFVPDQTYELAIEVRITDVDNDIDSVFVKNQELGLMKNLQYNVNNKIYQTNLTMDELNINDIEETIGLDFNIIVEDFFGRNINIGSNKVTRVIKNSVNIISPLNDSTTSATPELVWQKFKPGYEFSYMVEIYTNDFANSQLVFMQSGISSGINSFQITDPLPVDEYFWVVWVVDQFKNRSRSNPATFNVQ